MATYIQGVTDYLPVIQPFQPDYNFLSNILQTKQSRYDAAHKQLSSVYGTLLNSPMLRDKNIKNREEFFKAIDQDVQRISGMDLSLQQNQDIAMNLFKGFYEDKDMVKDMLWTKNYMHQLSRADAFRTCIDKEKCGGMWWEGGVKALNYRAQEFKNASDDEALNFSDVHFVPAQDFMGEAIKLAKDSGFSIKYDEVIGDWIVSTKNGSKMVQPLAEFFVSKFGSDPRMTQYYKTHAYVQRKDWVTQNLHNFASEDEANLAYVAQVYSSNYSSIKKAKKEADETESALRGESENIDRHIKENGYIPSMNFVNQWKDVKEEHAISTRGKQIYNEAYNRLESIGYNKDNIRFILDQVDNLVGLNMLKASAINAASAYSSLTSEKEIKADPFALQRKEHAFQRQMKKEEHAFQREMKDKEHEFKRKMKEEEWKRKSEHIENALKKIFGEDAELKPDPNRSNWSASEGSKNLFSYDLNHEQKEKIVDEIDNLKKQKVITVLNAAREAYAKGDVSYGDLHNMLRKVFSATKTGIDPFKLINSDSAEIAKFVELLNNKSFITSAYDLISPYADPNSALGAISRKWNSAIQANIKEIESELNLARQFYSEFDNWHRKVSKDVTAATIAELRSKNKILEADIFERMFEKFSKDGFYPGISTFHDPIKRKAIEKATIEWVTKNIDDPKLVPELADAYREEKLKPLNSEEISRFPRPLLRKLGGKKFLYAYKFALNSLSNNYELWRDKYADHGKAWDNPRGERGTNAKATMVLSGYVDAVAPAYGAGKTLMEMIDNYNNLRDKAVVVFGKNLGAGKDYYTNKLLETDEKARALLEKYIADHKQGSPIDEQGIPKDEGRASGFFELSRIGAQKDNLVAFMIRPSFSWGKKLMSKKNQSDNLLEQGDDKYLDGIVVYLPKDEVKGDFMRLTEYTKRDFIMEMKGQLEINSPGGGKAILTKMNDRYYLMTTVDVVNDDGTIYKDGNTVELGTTLDLNGFSRDFQSLLDRQSQINVNRIFEIAARNGTRNPNEVFNH